MNYFILTLAFWFLFIGVAFWRRRVYRRMTPQARRASQWRWAGNSPIALLLKVLMFVGMLCIIANAALQGLDMRDRNARMRQFRGKVAFYIVKHRLDSEVHRIRAELYNGSKSQIQVARILPDLLRPEVIARRVNGEIEPIPLSEKDVAAQSVVLPYDHAVTVNFAVGTNLLPRVFSIYYSTSDGNLTNAVITVDKNIPTRAER